VSAATKEIVDHSVVECAQCGEKRRMFVYLCRKCYRYVCWDCFNREVQKCLGCAADEALGPVLKRSWEAAR